MKSENDTTVEKNSPLHSSLLLDILNLSALSSEKISQTAWFLIFTVIFPVMLDRVQGVDHDHSAQDVLSDLYPTPSSFFSFCINYFTEMFQ